MFVASFYDFRFYLYQLVMHFLQVDRLFFLCQTNIASDIQIIVIVLDFLQRNLTRITRFLFTELVSVNYLIDIFITKIILAFSLFVMLVRTGIDEENLVILAAFL